MTNLTRRHHARPGGCSFAGWGTAGVDPAARELAQLVAAAGQGGGLGGVACQVDGPVVRGA
jgi:hypothetical protein